jgi:hypothetical protein
MEIGKPLKWICSMELDDNVSPIREVKKSLRETVVRSVTEIRYEDNSVRYSITETLSRSLNVENVAIDFGDRQVTRPLLDTEVSMTRTWLDSSSPNDEN